MKRLTIAALALVAAGNAPAAGDKPVNEALYRADQPPVLKEYADRNAQKEQRAQSEAQVIGNFRAAYQRASRPKFLMLWHRELSDNINSNREVTAAVSSVGERARDNFQRTINVQWKDGSERPVSLLPPARGAEFESGFQQAWRSAGAALVDRNTAIRMTALNKTKEGTSENSFNFQTIEATALADYASYFIEARFVPDPDAKGGTEPRVTVISSRTGEILADIVPSSLYKQDADGESWMATDAGFVKSAEGASEGEWRTDSKGFVKVARKRGGQEEGRAVALAIMQLMADNWDAAGK